MTSCECGGEWTQGRLGVAAVGMMADMGFRADGDIHAIPRAVQAVACGACGRVELRVAH